MMFRRYNIALTTVMLRKLEGGSLVGLPAIADVSFSCFQLRKIIMFMSVN